MPRLQRGWRSGIRKSGRKTFSFKCADCGELHHGSPSFSYSRPVYLFDVPEAERESRVKLSKDLCRILPATGDAGEKQIFCIRTILEIPIHGVQEPFSWGVWVTQSKESFDRYVRTYNDDQSGDGSFGWLAVSMPYYKRTGPGEELEHLECDVNWRAVGKRPQVTINECDHPLYSDQAAGISWEKAEEIARLVIHGRN